MGGRLTPPSRATFTRVFEGRYALRPARTRSPSAWDQSRKSTESVACSGTTFVVVPDAATVGTTEVRERVGEKREARHLEKGRSPFLRLEARVGGHAREARRHETSSFPRDFRGSAIARRLEDKHAVPVQGLADEEIPGRAAPDLFVRRQEEGHALRGLQVAAHDGFEDGDCHRHAALHVEDAWPPGDALLDTERDFRQRAGGPDGVDVAEQERAPAPRPAPPAEGAAPARAGHAGGRDPRFLEPRRDPSRELADERRLARRALAD